MCPPFIGMEGRNGMANTVKKEGRDGGHAVTRGQWPFRPAATRAMRNRHVMLYDFHYLGIYVHIAYKSHFNGF